MKTVCLILCLAVAAATALAQEPEITRWETLAEYLPAAFMGLERKGEPEGSTIEAGPNSTSTARADYIGDTRQIGIAIKQVQSGQDIVWMGLQAGLDYTIETPDETGRPVTIGEFPGRTTFHPREGFCSVVILLEKPKIIVEVTARGVDSADPVVAACETLPLANLNALPPR